MVVFRGGAVSYERGNRPPLGPYSRTKPRALWWSSVGELFLMSEVPLLGLWIHLHLHVILPARLVNVLAHKKLPPPRTLQ